MEIALKLFVWQMEFFKEGWNVLGNNQLVLSSYHV